METRAAKTPISFRDLVRFIFKRKGEIALVFAITLLLAIVGTYITPRMYEAYSTVYVVRSLPPNAAVSPAFRVLLDRKEVLNSEVDFIKSRAVAEPVATALMASAPKTKPPASALVAAARAVVEGVRGFLVTIGLEDGPGDPKEELIEYLQGRIKAVPALNSDMITLSYRDDDPEYATNIVNSVTRTYLERRLSMVRRPGLAEFYDNQVRRSQETLEALENETRQLKAKTGVVDLPEETRLKLQELSSLEVELNQARRERLELRERITALGRQADAQPNPVTTTRTMLRNPAVVELERKRLEIEAQKAVELNRFAPGSPPIVELDKSIERINAAIAELPATILNTEAQSSQDGRSQLQSDIYRAESDHTAKTARESVLLSQIDSLKQQIRRLDGSASEVDRLTGARASAEKIYRTYAEQREEARIAQETDPSTANVQVVHYAAMPTRPLRSRSTMIILGAMLGLLLGVSVAFVRELFDTTLNTAEDVERELGLHVLASLPDSKAISRPL